MIPATSVFESDPHPGHPVRKYLVFAILTILSIVAVNFLLHTPAVGQRMQDVRGEKKYGRDHAKLSGLVPLAPDAAAASCRLSGALIPLPGIPEASGVAASQRTPGVLWTHKDSGKPELFALDAGAALKGRVLVPGVAIEDWEDLAIGPCRGGSCLYLADIGDNDEKRPHISVYRVPEPLPSDAATRPAEAFHATYPDGPQDAEALVVSKEGRILVVTKGNSVSSLAEPQGEGVALGAKGELSLVGEGGGKSRAGSLARAVCTLAAAHQ